MSASMLTMKNLARDLNAAAMASTKKPASSLAGRRALDATSTPIVIDHT